MSKPIHPLKAHTRRTTSGTHPPAHLAHAGKHSAHEKKLPVTSGYEPKGKRPSYMNPAFQVKGQNEPTPAHPVSQHKQFKGHMAGATHISRKY